MRLTIAHLMKLVIYAAAALACVVPALELSELPRVTPLGILAFEATAIPLVWAMLSLFLVKDGPLKDTLIIGLVLISVSVTLVLFLWLCVVDILPALMRPPAGRWPRDRLTATAAVLLLAGAWVILFTHMIQKIR